MGTRLRDIIAAKRRELETEGVGPAVATALQASPAGFFKNAVCRDDRLGIIAEIKKASPSAGVIRDDADPVAIAAGYQRAGAAAVSVVTEKVFFKGSPGMLSEVRRSVSIPVLRKDFIIDECQIHESRHIGADAVLLIARILSREKLAGFLKLCARLELAALTEVHSAEDMEKALLCGADMIGINNRDLDSFDVSLEKTELLAPMAPAGCCLVSESGVRTPGDLRRIRACGVSAALVGTAFMSAVDPAEAAATLVRAGMALGRGG